MPAYSPCRRSRLARPRPSVAFRGPAPRLEPRSDLFRRHPRSQLVGTHAPGCGGPGPRPARRVLQHGVRRRSRAADLLWRARGAGRRSPESSGRPRPAARRRRSLLSRGILQARPRRPRPADRGLRAGRPEGGRAAAGARLGRGRARRRDGDRRRVALRHRWRCAAHGPALPARRRPTDRCALQRRP